MLGSFFDVHPPQADSNSARRDNDDLVAILPQPNGRLDNETEDGKKRLVALFVHDRASSCRAIISLVILVQRNPQMVRFCAPGGTLGIHPQPTTHLPSLITIPRDLWLLTAADFCRHMVSEFTRRPPPKPQQSLEAVETVKPGRKGLGKGRKMKENKGPEKKTKEKMREREKQNKTTTEKENETGNRNQLTGAPFRIHYMQNICRFNLARGFFSGLTTI
jgi:hypothetical protein